MESRLGRDFSDVRIHTDARAAQSARAVNALAYTVGRNVVFDRGRYAPQSAAGRALLAHELAHVAQQHDAVASDRRLTLGDPSGAAEREARQAASSVLCARTAANIGRQPIQLQATNGAGTAPAGAAPTGAGAAPAGTPPAAPSPARDVIGIRLDHRESAGLGRFDAILFGSCEMKIQLRMNFNFLGAWPNTTEQLNWQQRFITSVQSAWSRRHTLRAAPTCSTLCPTVTPFVQIYAPHTAPHVNADVTWTSTGITSRAGSGVAHLDSLDLTPERKQPGVEPMVPATHEFGHLLGRPDLYRPGGTCAPGYPLQGIMCFGNTVQAADYQPFANALTAMRGCTYTT